MSNSCSKTNYGIFRVSASLGVPTFRTYIPRRSNGNSTTTTTSFFHQGKLTEEGNDGPGSDETSKSIWAASAEEEKGALRCPAVSW